MTTHQQSGHQQSATIVPFPVGARAGHVRGATGSRRAEEVVPAVDWRGWYHGEAIGKAENSDHH